MQYKHVVSSSKYSLKTNLSNPLNASLTLNMFFPLRAKGARWLCHEHEKLMAKGVMLWWCSSQVMQTAQFWVLLVFSVKGKLRRALKAVLREKNDNKPTREERQQNKKPEASWNELRSPFVSSHLTVLCHCELCFTFCFGCSPSAELFPLMKL